MNMDDDSLKQQQIIERREETFLGVDNKINKQIKHSR